MSKFGWSYPPGAENDPFAPWHREDPPETCPMCGESNSEADDADADCYPYCSEECAKQDDGIDEP